MPELRGQWAHDGNEHPAPPLRPPGWFGRPLQPADVKRGSRSRAGQSAAEGGGAKRWPERDREPLFYHEQNRGPPSLPGQSYGHEPPQDRLGFGRFRRRGREFLERGVPGERQIVRVLGDSLDEAVSA